MQNTNNKKNISCPDCGALINVEDILRSELENQIDQDYKNKWAKKVELFKEQEKKLNDQKNIILKAQSDFDDKLKNALEEKLNNEKILITEKIKEKLQEEQELSIAAIKKELDEQNNKLKDFNLQQIEIEKIKREKEQLKTELNAEFQKKFNEDLVKEKEVIAKNEKDRVELTIIEQNQKIENLVKELDNAKRKVEQGSMQIQGEVQEIAIEEWIENQFPLDSVEEVKKGQRGADCIQIVNTFEKSGVGKILYESKRTKEFQNKWISKFKDDIRDQNADLGILVTSTMPKDMDRFGMKDGIWICNYEEFKGLSAVMRETLVMLSKEKKNQENVTDKATILYNYLTSNEFGQTIQGIIDGFKEMQSDLESEKRSMQRIWKKREKQIDRILTKTTYFYGSVQGLAGKALPHLKELDLESIADKDEEVINA